MQSKGSYISILLLLFYYIFFFKDKIKKKLLIFFIITVLPIVSFETIIKIKIEYLKINNIKSRLLFNHSLVVDGKIIDYRNKRSWQTNISYVPQQIYLSDDSIISNIAFGVNKNEIILICIEIISNGLLFL